MMPLCSRGKGMGIGGDVDENDDEKDNSLLKSRYSMTERQVIYKTQSQTMALKD